MEGGACVLRFESTVTDIPRKSLSACWQRQRWVELDCLWWMNIASHTFGELLEIIGMGKHKTLERHPFSESRSQEAKIFSHTRAWQVLYLLFILSPQHGICEIRPAFKRASRRTGKKDLASCETVLK